MNESKLPMNYPVSLALPARRQPPSRNVFTAPPAPPAPEADTVSGAWHAIQRGKFVILACVAGALLLAVIVSGLQTPMYQAKTILELREPGKSSSPFVASTVSSDSATDSAIVTQVTLLHSDPLIRTVVQKLKLEQRPGFGAGSDSAQFLWRTLRRQELPNETPVDKAVRAADHNLNIRHQARIIEVTYNSPDPKLAADFTNTLVQEHMTRASTTDAEAAKQLRQWLDRETADLGGKLARSESEMQRYAEGAGLVQTSPSDTVTQQQLRLLSEELGRAEADRMMKQSRSAIAASAPADMMPQVIDNPVLKDYQTKLTELQQTSAKLQALLTPDSYKVKEVEGQIAVLKKEIDTELARVRTRADNEFRSAEQREKMLQARFNAESQRVTSQEAKFIHYGTLQQQLETTRALHAQLLEKAQQLAITSAAPNTDLNIVSVATPPARPYTPNYPLNLSLGLFAGLIGGVIIAVSREQVTPRLRAPGDSSMLLQLPELAAIPSIDRRRDVQYLLPPPGGGKLDDRLELAAWNGTSTLMIESIHDALASIMASCDRGCRVLVFTSPSPGDGKTTITANLAISLALCRKKVLLIDGDLRRPRLNQVFNVPLEPGLADALREADSKENPEVEKIHTLPVPSLSLMTSGKLSTTYAPLFGGNRLGHFLGRMRMQYDVILIDAPPVLHGPDARLLGRLADAAVLITRARKTSRQDAVAAASRLAADRIPLAGTILNDWNPRSDSSAYSSYIPAEPEIETAVQ